MATQLRLKTTARCACGTTMETTRFFTRETLRCMILCIDIGNTRTTFALMHDGALRASQHESSRHLSYKRALQALRRLCGGIAPGEITAAGIASVVPFLTTLVGNAANEASGCAPFLINAE